MEDKQSWLQGKRVQVFQKPLTEEFHEGEATVTRVHLATIVEDGNTLWQCDVLFDGETKPVERLVLTSKDGKQPIRESFQEHFERLQLRTS